ncbi:MAG: hypothetical protein ACI9WU_004972 [Myxococcota bacterium]
MIRLISCTVLALVCAACSTDAVTLPIDFNEQKVKVVEVDYGVELGPAVALPGVQGGPIATVLGDAQLLEQFLKAGIDTVRLPQGYLCDYTLSGVFPSPAGNPDDPAAYSFGSIDAAMAGASALGGVVLWQAIWDVGLTNCDEAAQPDGSGKPPADKALWAKVVVNTLRHFNSDLLSGTPGAVWDDPSGREFGVRHVEFLDDPMGRGGYTDVTAVVDDFVLFAESVKTAFPNVFDGTPRISVVGPAMSVGSAGEVAGGPILQFLDELITRGKIDLLDVLSFQTAVTHPAENGAIAVALRAALDERALSDRVELWATRYTPDPTLPETEEPTNELQVGPWSIYAGAFATATKIHWQETVDRAIFYRGDRRHRSIDGSNISIVEQSPLWDKAGQWRPAGIAWQPWRLMTGGIGDDGQPTKRRLQVRSGNDVDADGLAVLAVREDNPCPDALFEQCPKVFVLVANTNVQLGQSQVDYQLNIAGLTNTGEGTRQVRINWSIIDETTREFTFAESTLITLIDDELFYQFESSVPAVDFLEIELNPR